MPEVVKRLDIDDIILSFA